MTGTSVIVALILNVAGAAIFVAIQLAFGSRFAGMRLVKCALLSRRKEVRVSIAALLKVSNGGSVVLFRMTLRREAFGPPGGVVKFFKSANPILNELDFVAERVPLEKDLDHGTDLRGMLPAKNLLKFRRWLDQNVDRETYEQCLRRELVEEASEVGLGKSFSIKNVTFHRVRRVQDGPKRVEGHNYLQFRIFEVLEIHGDTAENRKFCNHLVKSASLNDNVILCDADDIRYGRNCDGLIVASLAQALVSNRVTRADQPLYRPA